MAIENFQTYAEVDASSHLTITASRATGANVGRDEDVYLYKDFGVDNFDGLNITFELYVAATSVPTAAAAAGGIAFANVIDDVSGHATTDINVFIAEETSGFKIYLERGPGTAADEFIGVADTLYYCTLSRVAGNDTATLKIYSDAVRSTLLDTLTVIGFGTAKWRYCYGFVGWNVGVGYPGVEFDGYVQNMEILVQLPVVIQYQAPVILTSTTATGNAVLYSLGLSAVTAHGHCWKTYAAYLVDGILPLTTDSVVNNGAGALGAFTSAITGLTAGVAYIVRAYATNTQGTGYSAGLYFIAGATTSIMLPGNIAMKGEYLCVVTQGGSRRKILGDLY